LSLSNYAAPCLSPTSAGPRPSPCSLLNSPLSTPDAPKSEVRATPPFIIQTIIGDQPATSSFFEPQFKGTTAQWPSVSSNSDSPSGLGSSPESNSSQLCSSRSMTSPSATLFNSKSGSAPQSGSGTSSPKMSLDTDSDQLYNTFIRQWCFAQNE